MSQTIAPITAAPVTAAPLTPAQLDELYTSLSYRMTRAGDAALPEILARLSLLLMHEVGDSARIAAAIDAALAGFPALVDLERPA